MTEQSLFWTSGVGDGGPYSQDQLRILGNVLGKGAGANIGVIPSLLNMLVPSSSGNNNITAGTGYAIVDGTLYENDASKALNVASPSGGTTGVRLSLRKVWTDRQIRLTATKNTDGNAAIPSLVQVDGTTWDIPVATCKIATDGVISELTDVREFTRYAIIPVIISGQGATITTGIKGEIEIPFAMRPVAVRMFANQSGSIVIDFWKDTYSNYPPTVADTITASAKPTISSALKSEDVTLTGWDKDWEEGDVIRVNVDSVTDIQRLSMFITVAAS